MLDVKESEKNNSRVKKNADELANLKLLNSEISLASFKQYLYTGKLKDIENNENLEDLLLDLIVLATHFEIDELKYAVTNYLESIISTENVCHIFNLSGNSTLSNFCLMFMELHASKIIEQKNYRELSEERLSQLLNSSSFDVAEVEIFKVVKDWHEHNKLSYSETNVVNCIRFPLLGLKFLMSSEMKDSRMLTSEKYIEKLTSLPSDVTAFLRGTLRADENLALDTQGANLIEGDEYRHNLLEDNTNEQHQIQDRGYTSHEISEDDSNSILIELEKNFIINHITMRLYDLNERYDNTICILKQNTCFK